MLISTEVVVMTSKKIIFKEFILNSLLFSIGELDLAISDYSIALEIDSKNGQSQNKDKSFTTLDQ